MSKVKQCRSECGMKAKDLASKIEVSAMELSLIENDKLLPTPNKAKRLCEVLNKEFDELYTRAESTFEHKKDYRTGDKTIASFSVRLPREFKERFLPINVLNALGYKNEKDWLIDMIRKTNEEYLLQKGGSMKTVGHYDVNVHCEVYDNYDRKANNHTVNIKQHVEFELIDDSAFNDRFAKIRAMRQTTLQLKQAGNFVVPGTMYATVRNCWVQEEAV